MQYKISGGMDFLKSAYSFKGLLLFLMIITSLSDMNRVEKIYYLPFDIPGKQMAATIPPFGIFIENEYRFEGDGPGSVLAHERVHWNEQYCKMGLFRFYYSYLSEYILHGRIDHEMEKEVRKLSMEE